MATKNKILVWVGISSALLIGGGIAWWMYSKKKEEEEKKRMEEESAKQAELDKEQQKPNSPRVIQQPATPFTNKVDGDKFRAWVNKNYPSYAKQIDLSLSGDFNNSFIRKAYLQYGNEYNLKQTQKTTASEGYKSGGLVYLKVNNSSIYSYPDFKGDYIIGSITKSLILDKPFAKYISNTGKGFLKIETLAFVPKCPINARCTQALQPVKKIAYVPEAFVTDKPY